jgi:hypothetical protein
MNGSGHSSHLSGHVSTILHVSGTYVILDSELDVISNMTPQPSSSLSFEVQPSPRNIGLSCHISLILLVMP